MIDLGGIERLCTCTFSSQFGSKHLIIVWDKLLPSLAQYFTTDVEMQQFIKDNTDKLYKERFTLLFDKVDKSTYILNVCTVEDFGAFELGSKFGQKLVEKQMSVFLPIIKRFIFDNTP